MLELLREFRDDFERDKYQNESHISMSVIIPLLQELGWPIRKAAIPQYPVGGKKVDFALCHPDTKPIIFIEVKDLGYIDDRAKDQLMGYVHQRPVLFAVLTDGREWTIYAQTPDRPSEYDSLLTLNISDDDEEKVQASLMRYLEYEAVCSGLAKKNATEDYDKGRGREKAREVFQSVWETLLSDPTENFLDAISDSVTESCGQRPDSEDLRLFLDTKAEEIEELEALRAKGLGIKAAKGPDGGLQAKEELINKLKQTGINLHKQKQSLYETESGKLIGIAFANETNLNRWFLGLDDKPYFAIILICRKVNWDTFRLCLPPSFCSKQRKNWSRDKHGKLKFNITRVDSALEITIPVVGHLSVTEFLDNFECLKS